MKQGPTIILDFDSTLKRPVSSRYAEGMFNQLMRPDGKMFNVSTRVLIIHGTVYWGAAWHSG